MSSRSIAGLPRSISWIIRTVVAIAICLGTRFSTVRAADATSNETATQVTAHLAAGEFGMAHDLTRRVSDRSEQKALQQQITAAQHASGEPLPAKLGGGGAMADFKSLIELITQNTGGNWEEISGVGGTLTEYPYGVSVAPRGLLHRLAREEQTGTLASLGQQARRADLNADVARRSDLRLVSLMRLEKAVAARLASGDAVPETMARLAGLSQVKYVIADPENGDILIGGPAEGWQYNAQGQPVGTINGRPALQLDDLVTVLRTFASGDESFGCSINTREASVTALADFVKSSQSRPLSPTSVRHWVGRLQEKLGRQDIAIWGVPADSRIARVIVEADYRMKLIGIDKLKAGRDIPSYFDLLAGNPDDGHAMQALRWWLTMKYDAVSHSTDRTVFEIQGSSVLCQSENQIQTKDGKHLATGKSEATNQAFADQFTASYSKLAARDPVFAELQNIFDLALVLALIQHERLADRVNWKLTAFAPHGDYLAARYAVPTEVESVANHRVYNGRDIVVQVAGGVQGDVMSVVKDAKRTPESPRLKSIARQSQPTDLPTGRWWWDAK